MKTKAEQLAKELETRIERDLGFGNINFWDTDAKRVYSALHELVSYAIKLETVQDAAIKYLTANNYLNQFNVTFTANDWRANDEALKDLQALLNYGNEKTN